MSVSVCVVDADSPDLQQLARQARTCPRGSKLGGQPTGASQPASQPANKQTLSEQVTGGRVSLVVAEKYLSRMKEEEEGAIIFLWLSASILLAQFNIYISLS